MGEQGSLQIMLGLVDSVSRAGFIGFQLQLEFELGRGHWEFCWMRNMVSIRVILCTQYYVGFQGC